MKQAKIYNHNLFAGILTEDENGYTFQYDADYLQSDEAEAYCYQELAEGEIDFHPRCAKKIFGSKTVPLLPYSQEDIHQLAEQVVRSQATPPQFHYLPEIEDLTVHLADGELSYITKRIGRDAKARMNK